VAEPTLPARLLADFESLVAEGCSVKALQSSLQLARNLPALLPDLRPLELNRLAADLENVTARMKDVVPATCGGLSQDLEKRLRGKVEAYRDLADLVRPRSDRLLRIARAIPAVYVQQMTKKPSIAKVGRLLGAVGLNVGENYDRDVRLARANAGRVLDHIAFILYVSSKPNASLERTRPRWFRSHLGERVHGRAKNRQ
jgi:hypothetical protein